MAKITIERYAEIHALVLALPKRNRRMLEQALHDKRIREGVEEAAKQQPNTVAEPEVEF